MTMIGKPDPAINGEPLALIMIQVEVRTELLAAAERNKINIFGI